MGIWFNDAELARVRQLVAEKEPTATAIAAEAWAMAEAGMGGESAPEGDFELFLTACAVMRLLTEERRYALMAHDAMLRWTAEWSRGELKRGAQALIGAIVFECCYDAWTKPQRQAMTELLVKLHESFREILPDAGDPHIVTNNHWAVAHAGAALAARAVHQRDGVNMSEGLEWARERTRVFLHHFGDQGLYHEGLGYLAYPAAFLLPWLVADPEMAAAFPNLRNMAASLFSAACARPMVSDEDGNVSGVGMKLSWNDDGLGWCQSNTVILSMALAHEKQRGALRWMYDRLNGVHADKTFTPGWGGWFFTLLFYPYDTPAQDPNGVLPTHLTDTRQGLSVRRAWYRDANDAILGCYARSTFVGGHAHDDAGSVRFMALGHDWIMGGGQARSEAKYQSLVTAADGVRAKPYGLGAVIWDTPNVFGIDLRKPTIGYAERYVAVEFGADATRLALLDVIDDHLNRDWIWNITFERGLRCETFPGGFNLFANDGANLHARFFGSQPVEVWQHAAPDANRTYQSGAKKSYPGRPVLSAKFKFEKHLSIYVVMSVQRGPAPVLELRQGLNVNFGGQEWRRPFGAAIPAGFRLGVSGTLCRYPAGTLTTER